MASALRSRAAAAATRLLLYHQRSSLTSHHLLPTPSSGSHLEDSSFLLLQGLRNSSSSTTTGGSLVNGGFTELRDLCTRQDGRLGHGGRECGRCWVQQGWKRHSTSTSKKSESDGEIYASQMIEFVASQRKDVALHMEVSRILDQGYHFLHSQGPSTGNAAAKMLLMLATFHVDGGKLQDAVDVLQRVPNLEGVSAEVGGKAFVMTGGAPVLGDVSASQALVGVFLRMHNDSFALSEAQSISGLVNEASGLPQSSLQELSFRAAATVQFAEHATSSKTSGDLLDMSSLSSWLNDKEAHMEGVAAALLGVAECYHIRGHFSQAKDYYEKASALAEWSSEKGHFGLSAAAMTADEVVVRAEAGLGQAAAHLGDFDDAEQYLTKALTRSEQINGDKHPRVGTVLACLAEVYAQRGITKGSGDITLTEGLYRRASHLLAAPALDTPEKCIDRSDVIAITGARYAALLSRAKNRAGEAQKLQAWADAVWKGPCSLADVLAQDSSTKPAENSVKNREATEDAYTGRYVVIDVGLGRVLFTPTSY